MSTMTLTPEAVTPTATGPAPRITMRRVIKAEWIKLRSLRSTWMFLAGTFGVIVVFGLIYWINPDYLGGFFKDQRLMVAGMGGLTWMSIGAGIMAKMVSFEI